jgi:choice-of-anchor B domain-containing protein
VKHQLLGSLVLTLMVVSLLFSQGSADIEYLGNWNRRPTPSGIYSPYSACWGYTASDGREYALLGSTLGTSIIDITDAPTLTEVAFIEGPSSNWREMKTYGTYAYIVSDQDDPTIPNGVQIVSLADLPASATLLKTSVWVDTVNSVPVFYRRAHTISAEGKYLYLNGGNYNGIRILDLTDPVNPIQAGRYVGPYIHDSSIRNDTIFAAALSNGLDIVDARNKANPTRIKLHQYPGAGTHNVWTTQDGRYALTTDEVGSTPKTLKVWDLSDIQNLRKVAEVASINENDTAIVHNVVVRGTLAYVAWYTAGVKVLDISNPTLPRIVASYDTYPNHDRATYAGAWGVYPFPSGKIIVSDMQTGLYVLRYPPGVTSVRHNRSPVSDFSLSQNFPNPFNPTTTIVFTLPREERVRFSVLNVLGQEIFLVEDRIRPAGTHTIQLHAALLNSGVYFYKLVAGSFVAVKTMTVLK